MFTGLFRKKYDKKTALFILVFLAAVFLRFYHLREYFIFISDEARDAFVMKAMGAGKIVLCGPTASTGEIHLGPIFYYMLFPFFALFNFDPVSGAVMAALFAVMTVVVLYLFLRELCNRTIALGVSALYTLSPVVIHYARNATNPGTLPFFSTLFFYSLYKAQKGKDNFIFLAALCLGVMVQLHLTCIVFLVFFAAYFFYRKISFRGKHAAYSYGILLILLLPYFVYLFTTNFKDILFSVDYFSSKPFLKNPTVFDLSVYGRAFNDRGNILVNFEKTMVFFGYFFKNIFFYKFGWLGLSAGVLIFWCTIRDIFSKDLSRERMFMAWTLLLWVFLPIVGFTFCFKNFLRLHHLLFLFTAPFIGWAYLWHSFSQTKIYYVIFGLCTGIMLLIGAYSCCGYFSNMEKGKIDRVFLSDEERAVKFIAAHSATFDLKVYPYLYLGSYRYLLFINNLGGRCRDGAKEYMIYNIYPKDVNFSFGDSYLDIKDFSKKFKEAVLYRNVHVLTAL